MVLDARDRSFKGLENSLLELRLSNTSLSSVPELPLPALRTLHLAHNRVRHVPTELASSLTSLRRLDVSYNQLQVRLTPVPHDLPTAVDTVKEINKNFSLVRKKYRLNECCKVYVHLDDYFDVQSL
jgi:Leucine-rich repeat (LRR) protein